MPCRLSAARVALLPLCLLSVSANALPSPGSNCWKADEQRAAEVHNFQTMLMVGALKCRDSVPAALEGYNSFMSSKRDLIVANQYVLMSHFIREYGDSNGLGAFRSYETRVGNRHSGADNLARCEAIGAMSRMAAGASETDLRELAQLVGEDSLTSTCPNLAQAEEGLAPTVVATLIPAEQPAPVAATAPAVASTTTDLAANDAVSAPVEPVLDDPVPVEVTSTSGTQPKVITVEEAPAPAPSAAQALQEAARALAQAASALESQAAVSASAPEPKLTELANAPK